MIVALILPLGLILPGLLVLRLSKAKVHSNFEKILLSYILSMSIVFGSLYIGGIFGAFNIASYVVFAVLIASILYFSVLLTARIRSSAARKSLVSLFFPRGSRLIISLSIVLLSIYALFLSSKAVLDSDVVQQYLPYAREIVCHNGLVYSTGYDYDIFLKPIGGSVLYAWTYVISGSSISEDFRLMSLVPVSILIISNYVIATRVAGSRKIVGLVSTAIFLVLPLHDTLILYASFYPDIYYYPLIFTVIYLLLDYFKTGQNSPLFWSGMALGVGSLIKAQTVYFVITLLLIIVISQMRSKKLSLLLCFLAPYYIVIIQIFAQSIQREGFSLSIPSVTPGTLLLFVFLGVMSGSCYAAVALGRVLHDRFSGNNVITLLNKLAFLLVPIALLSSLWYVNNLVRFGTLISTSSINLPNYDWALQLIKSIMPAQSTVEPSSYIPYFLLGFVDPYYFGYVMIVPLLIGFYVVYRERLKDVGVLLLFEILSVTIILSNVVIALPAQVLGYNPRDMIILTPLLTAVAAIGITYSKSNYSRQHDTKRVLASLLLVGFFGFMTYVHSVLVWETSLNFATIIGTLMSAFSGLVGLDLTQTSLQLSYSQRVTFVSQYLLNIGSLAFIAGAVLLLLITLRNHSRVSFLRNKPRRRMKSHLGLFSSRRRIAIGKALVISLVISVIVIPRADMLAAQGGPQGIKSSELAWNYKELYGLVADPEVFNGSILTFRAPMGLPYYIPGVQIIDLIYPANLAYLRDCLQLASPNDTVTKLNQLGIHYLLIDLLDYATQQLDDRLNYTFSVIAQDPGLAFPLRIFGSMVLYEFRQ